MGNAALLELYSNYRYSVEKMHVLLGAYSYPLLWNPKSEVPTHCELSTLRLAQAATKIQGQGVFWRWSRLAGVDRGWAVG